MYSGYCFFSDINYVERQARILSIENPGSVTISSGGIISSFPLSEAKFATLNRLQMFLSITFFGFTFYLREAVMGSLCRNKSKRPNAMFDFYVEEKHFHLESSAKVL